MALGSLALIFLGDSFAHRNPQLTPFLPTTEEVRALYRRADSLQELTAGRALQLDLGAKWIGDDALWYRKEGEKGTSSFIYVEAKNGKKSPLFDHEKLAKILSTKFSREVVANKLPITVVAVDKGRKVLQFKAESKNWKWDVSKDTVEEDEPTPPTPQPERSERSLSNDKAWRARVRDGQIEVKKEGSEEWTKLTSEGQFERFEWAPDQPVLAAYRIIPGDRKEVFTIQSNVPGTTRGVLKARRYDQPGDVLDSAELFLVDPVKGSSVKAATGALNCGGWPWANPPSIDWWKPKGQPHATMIISDETRGYQQIRILEIDPITAKVDLRIDEKSETFVNVGQSILRRLENTRELIWRSERSGWSQLYKVQPDTGTVTPITQGEYVVRSVESIDEAAKSLLFMANAKEAGNPYLKYLYRASLDGKKTSLLTPGNGDHTVTWSPGRKFLIDTYSRVDSPPIHELRRADGTLVSEIDRADVSAITLPMPEPFVAKSRDGVTDIYGVVFKPTHFDPSKSYPIIEDIYAGPHDSFTPINYRPLYWHQRLAELGFFVVQMDGMGTSNRGKKFHDIAWKNIADAGFPDRILWMKALGQKYPQIDLERVGVYGTSAGGQNSTGAVLFHPDFYKVAVSSCGCHDNRIDKIWWNEQWMGYPVGDHYAQQSNITNASRLKGNLLLMVGEVDSNVPPESTYRLADALIKAGREFDLVALPGLDHTSGGAFGERKRRDFFVRNLLGVKPPSWNE